MTSLAVKSIFSRILILICLTFSSVWAQQNLLRFEHIRPEEEAYEGLVSGMQDHLGYLWLCTTSGLVRHDAQGFKLWANDPGDPYSLPGNDVAEVSEISDSLMWVVTKYTGLARFNRRNSRFTTFRHDPKNPLSVAAGPLESLRRGPQGTWWLGSMNGLQMIRPETVASTPEFLQVPLTENPESDPTVLNFLLDGQENAWLPCSNGLRLIAANDLKAFIRQPEGPHIPSQVFLPGERILYVLHEKGAGTWISGIGGIWFWPEADVLARDETAIVRIPASMGGPTTARHMLMDSRDNLWFASNGQGIFQLSPAQRALRSAGTMHFVRYDYNAADPGSFVGGITNYLLEDRSGNIWGFSRLGLDMLNPQQRQFGYSKPNPAKAGYSKENEVYALLAEADGSLWVGTQDGLSLMDKAGNRLGYWRPAGKALATPYLNAVRSIVRMDNGLLMVSTLNGLWQFDPATGSFASIPGLDDEKGKNITRRIFKIVADSEGGFWLGGIQGLLYFHPKSGAVWHNVHLEGADGSLGATMVRNLLLDQQQNLWIATENGLDLLTKKQQSNLLSPQFRHFRHQSGDTSSLSINQVRALAEAPDGSIWVGTDGGGLNRYDPMTEKFTRYMKKDGLANNIVYGLLIEENTGRVWASTSNGLSCLDPKTGKFENFGRRDGLQDAEFNMRAYAQFPDGQLVFGGVNGYNQFFPEEIQNNKPAAPRVVINGFRISNRPVSFRNSHVVSESFEFAKTVHLAHSDNIFSFEFAALEYTNPDKVQFMYRLRGFSDDWVIGNTENKATFTNLSPGNYTFEVKTSGWEAAPALLALVIAPPIWATWWAKLLYCVVGIALIGLGWRAWRNRMRMQAKLRQEKLLAERSRALEQIKSRFFAGISHEFRTPLALIIGPLEKMRSEIQSDTGRRNVDMIDQNARRLLRLVNQLLVVAGLEEGKVHLHPARQDLNLFLRQIVTSFRPGAEAKGVALTLVETDGNSLLCFDRENFEHIFYNLLANALKFTPEGGKIELRVTTEADGLRVEVADTGIGVAPDAQARIFERFYQVRGDNAKGGTGLGLALVRELTELHGGTVEVQSRLGHGTTFGLTFPFENGLVPEQSDALPVAALERELWPVAAVAASELDTDKPIVLVVEDNADLRGFIRSELEDEFTVLEAPNGAVGLELAKEQVPDLVISDVMMPVMDGLDLSRALKDAAATSHIPIILLTARASEASRIEGLEAGADDYLSKPFSATELRLRIRNRFAYQQMLASRLRAAAPNSEGPQGPVKRENEFLRSIQAILEAQLDNSGYSVEDLAAAVNLNRKQLYRKVKALTEKTPSQYVRSFRLLKGKVLLQEADLNVSEVAYSVGFSSPSYFTRCFQQEFGHPPSEIRNGNS